MNRVLKHIHFSKCIDAKYVLFSILMGHASKSENSFKNDSDEIWGQNPSIELRVKALDADKFGWAGAVVRIYLDGKLVGQTTTDLSGHAYCQIPKPCSGQRIEIDVTSASVYRATREQHYYGWDWITAEEINESDNGRIETEIFLKPWTP